MEIIEVRIQTAQPNELHRFYGETLGQPVDAHGDGFVVTIGATSLVVSGAEPGTIPAYHLAFTIPRNALPPAKAWLAQRTALLTDADGQDQFRFDEWEAEAIYFSDPAGTILELIAWEALANDARGPFGPTDLLAVSEVGVVVPDVPATVARLGEAGFAPYRDDWSPDFAPVGDAIGRLIVVRTDRPWFPVGTPAAPAPLTVVLRGDHDATIPLPGNRSEITTRSSATGAATPPICSP